jgi:hypothetical protein
MSGPAAVLVAGGVTMWIAFASADSLVAEDYYRQGLGINRVLAREDAARKMGLDAQVSLRDGKITIDLKGQEPEALFVHLAHATRAGYDQRLRLAPVRAGVYEAALPPLAPGHWHLTIEDPRGAWRIVKEIS